jgi:hypothetical protein
MSEQAIIALNSQFMPVMDIANAIARRNAITDFVKTVMVVGTDYGTIPGTDKPTLLKAGAEKLNTLFGLSSHFIVAEKETDWTGVNHNGEPFFYFVYRCQLYRGDLLISESDGSCNSMEKKYRYRWIAGHEAKRMGLSLDTLLWVGVQVSLTLRLTRLRQAANMANRQNTGSNTRMLFNQAKPSASRRKSKTALSAMRGRLIRQSTACQTPTFLMW